MLRLIGEVGVIVLRSRTLRRVLLVWRLNKHSWIAIWCTVVWRRLMLEVRRLIVNRAVGSG
jgi:hypothetical protein